MKKQFRFKSIAVTAIAFSLALATRVAWAHAVLVKSSPAAHSTVQGGDLPIALQFNSRVDGVRSTIQLIDPSGQSKALTIGKQAAPDTLTAAASHLESGKYTIRWQALATDGHITRGEIPFEVK